MEVKATDKAIKSSVQKLNIVADLIRYKKVDYALLQLSFSRKKNSSLLKKVLLTAIANSQNNFNLDIDKLYVKEVLLGKSMTLKRSSVRARGRIDRINKPFSRVTIVLEERDN